MGRRRRSNPFTLFAFQDIITSVMGIMLLSALLLAVELITRHEAPPPTDGGLQAAFERATALTAALEAEIARLDVELTAATRDAVAAAAALAADAPRRQAAVQDRTQRIAAELAELQTALDAARRAEAALQARKFERRSDFDRLDAIAQQLAEIEAQIERLRQGNRLFFRPDPTVAKTAWLIDFAASRILLGPLPSGDSPEPPAAVGTFAAPSELLDYIRRLPPDGNYFIVLIRPSGVESHGDLIEELRNRDYQFGFDVLAEDQAVFAEAE